MKKFFYSTGTKVCAFILLLTITFTGVYKLSMIVPDYMKLDNININESRLEANIYSAFSDIFSLMGIKITTGYENYVEDTDTADTTTVALSEDTASSPVLSSQMKIVSNNFKYYATDANGVYTNMSDDESTPFKENLDAFLVSGNRTSVESYLQDGGIILIHNNNKLTIYHNYKNGFYFNSIPEDEKDFLIFLTPTQSYLNTIQKNIADAQSEYNLLSNKLKDNLLSLLWYPLAMLILAAYLFAVCGRNGKDKEVHTLAIDNFFEEITGFVGAVIFVIMCIGALFGLDSISYRGGGSSDNYVHFYILISTSATAACAVLMGVLLSYTRNLKRREFIKRSFILTLAVRTAKFIFESVKKLQKAAKPSVFSAGIAAAYGIVMVFADNTFIRLIFTVVFLVLFLRSIIGFDDLAHAIKEFSDGNIDYKTNSLQNGIMGDLCREVDKMGKSMNIALDKQLAAERMKSQLITNVSHDLKTPLTSIINYSELLGDMELSPEEAADYVKIIKTKALRLKTLTSDLFDISKVQSGNETMDLKDIDAGVLITQSLGELDEEIEKSNLTFCTSIDDECIIKGDGEKLSRVFENIFINAVKYSLGGTRVYVSCEKREPGVHIEVKNISAYPLDFDVTEICERFVRGDESRSTEGNGLGLAIAKSYTETMGGIFKVITDGDLFKIVIEFK